MPRLLFFLFVILLPPLLAAEQPPELRVFRSLASAGQGEEAFRVLLDHFNKEKKDDSKARMALGLGIMAYNKHDYPSAKTYLEQSLKLNTRLEDYAHFYLGMSAHESADLPTARAQFELVRNSQLTSVHLYAATHELAHINIEQKKWSEAYGLLTWLERKGRKDLRYSEVLKDLMLVSLVRNQKWLSCRWAQKYYSKYAAESLSLGWGLDLSKAEVEGSKLGCVASPRDMDKRFNSLLVSGEFEQAKKELDELAERTKHTKGLNTDMRGQTLLKSAQLSLAQGHVDNAIEMILQAQQSIGLNFTVAMLLAKAYSRTDDYLNAVECYLKAHRMRPGSKLGKLALFQAAFLSYQNRDYDGAQRRFEDFVKKYPRSAMSSDSRWHLAWIRYLKGDYEGALRAFESMSRRSKGVDLEKITYWRAMAYLKLNQASTAKMFFDLLSKQRRLGYYTAAARARLTNLPAAATAVPLAQKELKQMLPPSLLSNAPDFSLPATIILPTQTAISAPAAGVSNERVPQTDESSAALEDKSAEQDSEKFSVHPETPESDEEEEASGGDGEPSSGVPLATPGELTLASPFKDPLLLKRFDKANDLLELGFDEWAKMELREIEKRTSNRGYLESLMTEYIKAGDFYRGAYIADVIFSSQRERGGLEKALVFWEQAFPQAFGKQVIPQAKKFDISSSLVWGIMRAESSYKTDVHSGAGALGLMQLIPPTAFRIAQSMSIQGFKVADLLNPEINILFGSWYLRRLNKVFKGHLPLVIAAYNAGPHRVQGWLKDFGHLEMDEFVEHIPYLETRNYTKKVLRNIFVYRLLYEKQLSPLTFLAQKPSIKFEGPKPEKENWDPI